jgi:iron complex transport system permease protein
MKNYRSKLIFSLLALALVSFLSLALGTVPLNIFKLEPQLRTILDLRIIRTIFAGLTGISLALTGTLYQAMLLNPLAEPYLLGVSAGGALGAVFCLFLGKGNLFIFAVCGSLLALLIVFMFAGKKGHLDHNGLILSGVMVNSFCSALIMLIITLAGSKVNSMMFWLMGDISSAQPFQLWFILPALFLLLTIAMVFSNSIDALSLGEEQACYLGINANQLKIVIFALSSLLTGLVVATVGIIGFIGLVIPHVCRLLVGEKVRSLLPFLLVIGAGFTILTDLLSRIILPDIVLPIGILTALIGVPFFIIIYKKY